MKPAARTKRHVTTLMRHDVCRYAAVVTCACLWSRTRKGQESLKEVTLRTFPSRAGFSKMEFESPVPEHGGDMLPAANSGGRGKQQQRLGSDQWSVQDQQRQQQRQQQQQAWREQPPSDPPQPLQRQQAARSQAARSGRS